MASAMIMMDSMPEVQIHSDGFRGIVVAIEIMYLCEKRQF